MSIFDDLKKSVLQNLLPVVFTVFAVGLALGMIGYNHITVADEPEVEEKACLPPAEVCLNGSDNVSNNTEGLQANDSVSVNESVQNQTALNESQCYNASFPNQSNYTSCPVS